VRREPQRWVALDDGSSLAAWVSEPADGAAPVAATVVLVHGWTLAAAAWDRSVAALAAARADLRVIRYDQRGHGASRGRPRPAEALTGGPAPAVEAPRVAAASIRRLGDDLVAAVEQLAPQGPLVLVGHSMGGMAVLSAVGAHPGVLAGRPCAVLLCSTSAGSLSAAGRPLAPLMAALATLPENVLVPRAPRLLTQRTSYGPGVDPALVAETLRAIGPVSGRSTGEWFAALMAHDETAALPALAAAGVPVRVLVGDADRMTPPSHAHALAEALPGAGLTVVPGAGHMLFVERPDVVVEAVLGLLADLGA
jgi:pimeloyl-ACP methyl ester carboxylesterase